MDGFPYVSCSQQMNSRSQARTRVRWELHFGKAGKGRHSCTHGNSAWVGYEFIQIHSIAMHDWLLLHVFSDVLHVSSLFLGGLRTKRRITHMVRQTQRDGRCGSVDAPPPVAIPPMWVPWLLKDCISLRAQHRPSDPSSWWGLAHLSALFTGDALHCESIRLQIPS